MSTSAQAVSLAVADRMATITVSSTMKVAADADRMRREGIDVVDFGAGEPDFPTPDNIKQAAIDAINKNFTKYTPAGGTQDLKQAIVDRHRIDYGTNYTAAETVVSVGGKHVCFNAMQAVINPGDEVIIPVPYWVTYKDVVNYAYGKCVFVETNEADGFNLTAAMIEKALTPKTKMVLINSPSNPSGAVLPNSEFIKIFELTKERGIWLMTDECYCRFLYDAEPFSIAAQPGAKDNVIVAGSLSKTYSMTGWRIGFALAPAQVASAMMKLQSHSTSNPTSIAQKASVEALRGPQDSVTTMLAAFRERRDFVVNRMRQIPGVSLQVPQGAFYVYPNLSGVLGRGGINTPMQFCEKLLTDAYVAVVPGEAFGTDKHVRISYATSMHELERGLDRMHKYIESLG
ncbi:MAG: pyridoxal phosphate-dependent aminotransferase [Acidobacteria bacterium]|nr:pyridoxal phosphate-dependent aminotransferase [Acidobacteriota bacterium]